MYPPSWFAKTALPSSRWVQDYLPPPKAQLKECSRALRFIVFPECVAKLHTWKKPLDGAKNPYKPLFSNNIFV
jgi:hypothetical protein